MSKGKRNPTPVETPTLTEVTTFRTNRVREIQQLYADDISTQRRLNRTPRNPVLKISSAAEVRALLDRSLTDRTNVVELSKKLYAINPIYAGIINYLSNMFMWRYTVTPRKVFKNSKAQQRKDIPEEKYNLLYHQMLEIVDGLSIETKFPALLSLLLIQGAVYFTTIYDQESWTIDTLLLPDKYCRKVGETQYGTAIIQFNFAYFDDLALDEATLKDYFEGFPEEFQKLYKTYKRKGSNYQWQQLDPHFSSGILMNDYGIPNFFYLYGSILSYEHYQDNELERSDNMLKYLVVETMPIYQDQPVFEMDEVKELHHSIRRVIDKGDKVRLITTFADKVDLLKVADSDTSENTILEKAYNAIYHNTGLNDVLFTGNSVEALRMALVRDKGFMWKFVQALLNFYTIAINNWFDFKELQADIDILPISPYTYNDDIEVYRENATLGVGKLNYIVASGIKQKNIEDLLKLEDFLHLDQIKPMQTSYTQTAVDRKSNSDNDTDEGTNS